MYLLFFAISTACACNNNKSQVPRDVVSGDVFGQGSAFEMLYTLSLPAKAIEDSPKWRESDNPPLSAKSAIRVAEKAVIQMEVRAKGWSEFWSRSVSDVALVAAGDDHWYWVVHFLWVPREGNFNGQAPQLSVGVTMDGQAVIPILAKDQRVQVPGNAGDKAQ